MDRGDGTRPSLFMHEGRDAGRRDGLGVEYRLRLAGIGLMSTPNSIDLMQKDASNGLRAAIRDSFVMRMRRRATWFRIFGL